MPPQIPKKINPPIFITVLLVVTGLLGSYQIYTNYYAQIEATYAEPIAPVSGIEGKVTVGDEPYQAHLRVTDRNGNLVQLFSTKIDGSFYAELPPGFYIIQSASTSTLPKLGPLPFRVIPESVSLINLNYSTSTK